MIKHQSLKIKVPKEKLDEYISSLCNQAVKVNYIRLSDIEKKLSEDPTLDRRYICLQTPRLHIDTLHLVAVVWLSIEQNGLVLQNITSNQRAFLSVEEYNGILNSFYKDVVLATKMEGIKRSLTKPTFSIRDVMGKKCVESLMVFSNCANKDSILTHDCDLERWAKFIKLAHRTNARINSNELEGWLKEEGWNEKNAKELAGLYEYSFNLLKHV